MLDNSIYFNREERFFTATVFPGIVCRNNFKYFSIFLSLLKQADNSIPECLNAEWSRDNKTILFFTEYSFKKSGHKYQKVGEEIVSGDTPDILFLICNNSQKYLFAFEGKMYSQCSSLAMKRQLERQFEILKGLAKISDIKIENIYHFGLVPEPMVNSFSSETRSRMITWEQLYNAYSSAYDDDYYLDVLKHAIDYYYDLRGISVKNSSGKLPGAIIYSEHIKRAIKRVGRGQGVKGLYNDLKDGSWKTREYEYGIDKNLPKINWISIDDFINIVASVKHN
jgi:hypothetical protein